MSTRSMYSSGSSQKSSLISFPWYMTPNILNTPSLSSLQGFISSAGPSSEVTRQLSNVQSGRVGNKSRQPYQRSLLEKFRDLVKMGYLLAPSQPIVQNVQDKSPGPSGTDHDSCREIEARWQERRNDLYKIFPRTSSSMMDIDDNQADHRSEINALIEARKVTLSQQQRQKVERILSGPQDNSIVIDKFNIDMTRSKFACLRERTWLNDEVINFYMSMLQERDDRLCQEQPGRSSSHYFNSFFMSKLLEKGTYTFSNVRRWTKKFDVLSKDKIFLPVNISNTHWTLAVVYVQKNEIVYFDSMNGDGTRYLQALARWFREDVKDKKGMEVDTSEWTLRNELNVPQQQNGFDCGVFAVTFADFLSDNLPLQFNQQEITENRLRFASSIIEGSLPY